ncbi:hypothetical protein P6F26_12070 [Roseibacterium sp. SDUM158017]|uniref:hypothetical protein n=1 Tax=Roseicyclus salinarum TaxID=3036773 RepID=UPI00241510D8|nr:hypothetical protein [Roseibacterium sp. SDUM158017]MDG4649185.1 hypothetical protein [Roseibacterium sp. SDUM158017]
MFGFISDHEPLINALSNVSIVLIWLVYLQLFFMTYRRQRRSSILIDRGGATDATARCIITNMGQEPIYLLAVTVEFGQDDGTSRAVVTDRDEVSEVSVPIERTTRGPLSQGEARDVGSLADLMHRAHGQLDVEIDRDQIRNMRVSAVAISNQGEHLVAASKVFAARHLADGRTLFEPETALTRQIRSVWRRRRLLDLLENRKRT